MVRFGSLRVGEESAVRLCKGLFECAFCENGVVAGVKGKQPARKLASSVETHGKGLH